jgi:predicted secreted protein
LGCHCDINGATSVLPAPVRLLEEEELLPPPPLPELELEPHAARPSDAATARSAVVVRISFVFMMLMLVRLSALGVSDP